MADCCVSSWQVNGALLSLGDAHTSQGDSEFDGTAIETSLTAKLKITLHKKGKLPKIVSKLNFPLLENANEYVVHGFTYNVSGPLSCSNIPSCADLLQLLRGNLTLAFHQRCLE